MSNIFIKRFLVCILTACTLWPLWSQENLFEFRGYVSNMQTVLFEDYDKDWFSENQIHNRLNLKYFATDKITFNLEIRNRFIYGDLVKYIPEYANLIEAENGWLNMSWLIFNERSFILLSKADRLWVDYTAGQFQVRAGRQRINWGQSMVWNPNDVFNAYSYFDFDYLEKPGGDAIRIQYYTGLSSAADFAVKIDSAQKVTAAGRYLFSVFNNYDLQFLAGYFNGEDLVVGTGWAGNIKGAGFRGELTWFHSLENSHDEEFMMTIGGDYSFKNSLYVGLEFLYSNIDYGDFSFGDYYFTQLNVKNIAFTDLSIFGQVRYQFTPLFSGTFAGMYFPSEKGFYLGPMLDYSLLENVTFSFIFQHFQGKFGDNTVSKNTFVFLRLKWNF